MVYVDSAAISKSGRKWFHLTADSLQELHVFAKAIGVTARAFHHGARHPHYDLTEHQRMNALRSGACLVTTREVVLVAKRIADSSRQLVDSELQLCLFD